MSQAKGVDFVRKHKPSTWVISGAFKISEPPQTHQLELRDQVWPSGAPLCSDLDNPDQCLSMAPRIQLVGSAKTWGE